MLIIGHKGTNDTVPGNTLEAIKRALEFNVDMIEIDVRVTKDNIVVLYHDSYVKSSGKRVYISNTNYPELVKIQKDLTTLEEVLKVSKKTNVLIDIKPRQNIEPIMHIISKTAKDDPNKILIASFDFKLLQKIHAIYPDINLAVTDRWSGVKASHRAKKLGTKILIMNQLWLWSGFIKSMNNSGYKLYAYTLNNHAKAKKWEKYGLTGVITDSPSIF